MAFFTEIGILFTGMTVPALIALILGFVFVVIEIFQPGFGIFVRHRRRHTDYVGYSFARVGRRR